MCDFKASPDCVESSSFTMDEVVDIIAVMQLQEQTIYLRGDFLANGLCADVVDATWRQRIVEWMFGVVDHCSLRRDSVAVASFYLDLCVERGVVTSRLEFQLAAMTALQLAIKLYDSTIVKLDSMIKLGRGLFTEEDVIAMESKMLSALKWQVHPPTSICFLRQFLRLLPPSVSPLSRYVVAEVTRFISEISVCLYKFVDCPASVIAYAGMLISMDKIDPITLPIWQRQQICECMLTAAKLDHQSPQVIETVNRLKFSLEKNVSLQSLMRTIDAQCRAGGYYQATPAVNESVSSVEPFRNQVNTAVHTNLNSPRDVFVASTTSEPLKTYGM
jgi:Cyclin, N-terminal domain/Cyclin, C-terminal domain